MDTTNSHHDPRKAAIDLQWHIGAFVIINAFFWLLDAITGGGITWAFWITIFWGFALAFHVLTWIVVGRREDGGARGSPAH